MKVHVVLGTPKFTSFSEAMTAKTQVFGVYFDEAEAAKDAGKDTNRWYVSCDVVNWVDR